MTQMMRPLAALTFLIIAGCSTPNVNPPSPRANTGYVDFYTDADLELSWEVKRAEEPGGELRTVYSELKPVTGTILRLATPPGSYQFQVWFMNQATEGPQTVAVQVENGRITPVHVTLKPAGSTSVDQKEYGFRGSAKRYGRGTKFITEQNQVYQVGLLTQPLQSYQPKERMAYFSAAPQ